MESYKGIPYGVAHFESVRRDNKYYVDKTMFLPVLENTGEYLFLIRPRRFGKSLFVTMMQSYYDQYRADKFDELFGGLWIHEHPTPLKNAYQMLYFDFSIANVGRGTLEENFDHYCVGVLKNFIDKYKDSYSPRTYETVINSDSPSTIFSAINSEAKQKGFKLYLIIDEYDNFTNVILSEGGKEVFRNLTHASGFYREYFKVFKAMFDRVFLIGVSPVTLDDLSSGYNIDWNISLAPEFNYMLGFSESDVRGMLEYYKEVGKIKAEADIDGMIEEMKPWYNNYCFAEECLDEERIFNCDMVLYYLRHQVLYNRSPKQMVDKNIRTDYSKLKMLADIDRGNRRESRMSVIEEVAATGELSMKLETSFPAEYVTDDNNFRSLLYYYGLLTMGSQDIDNIRMVIPNLCVREQYWNFLRRYYQNTAEVSLIDLEKDMRTMALQGEWRPYVERIARSYREVSSVRDSILGEHNLQGYFKAYLALSSFFLLAAEAELNYGYGDFVMVPDRVRYPVLSHAYVMELKYVKPTATDAELEAKSAEATAQLEKYSQDARLLKMCEGVPLHRVKVVFRGADIAVCEELGA